MDDIGRTFYKDSLKKCKKLSNEQLIMLALLTLLDDVNDLRSPFDTGKNSEITKGIKTELGERIYKDKK